MPIAAGVAWVAALAAGLGVLHGYEATPGRSGSCSRAWPAGSPLALDPTRANLVMLVHPRCPCSRASLAQLDRIMAACRPRLAATVVFLEPRSPAPGWRDTETWRRAAAISGVRCLRDPGGAEARRFGAMTSGHVLLYGGSGKLLFSGGITVARGDGGDNTAGDALIGLVAGGPDRARAAVFGCPLFEASHESAGERVACRR